MRTRNLIYELKRPIPLALAGVVAITVLIAVVIGWQQAKERHDLRRQARLLMMAEATARNELEQMRQTAGTLTALTARATAVSTQAAKEIAAKGTTISGRSSPRVAAPKRPCSTTRFASPTAMKTIFAQKAGLTPSFVASTESRISPVGTWIASPAAASGMAMRPTAAAPRPRSRTALMSNTPMPPTTKAAPHTCSRFETVKSERHFRFRKGSEAVVHDVEVEALQVRDVAWDVEGEYLPLALAEHLVPEGEAVEDQAALRGPVLIANDILVRAKGSHSEGQAEDSFPFLVSESDDALQLTDEWREIGVGAGNIEGLLRSRGSTSDGNSDDCHGAAARQRGTRSPGRIRRTWYFPAA
jgi:hypothetical protein